MPQKSSQTKFMVLMFTLYSDAVNS